MKYLRSGLILIALALAVTGVASAAIPDGEVGATSPSGEMETPANGHAATAMRSYLPLFFGPAPAPGGWTILLDEGFEGTPAAGWRFFDENGTAAGEYFWAKRSCRPGSGSYSAWAVGGGVKGAALPCNSDYPDNTDAWMVFGPFSLADAQIAQMRFSFYLRTLAAGDHFCWGASDDDVNFDGLCLDADPGGWTPFVFDLGNVYGDEPASLSFLGKPQVWIAFRFLSDATAHAAEGVYVDNLGVRKCPNLACYNPPSVASAPRVKPISMRLR